MDQSPLPRGSFQIRNCFGEEHRVVPELPRAAVAVEAQYPANPAGAMIVIDVLGTGSHSRRGPCSLGRGSHEVGLPDAVAPTQAVLTGSAAEPLPGRFAPDGARGGSRAHP